MNKKPILSGTHEAEPDTSRPGGRSWVFQGSELLTMRYSETFSSLESMTRTHGDYEQIIMISVGKANFWCGDEYYKLPEGCIIVVPPHIPRGIQQRTDSPVDLKILEIFYPADPGRPQSPKIHDLEHFNWQDL